MNIEPANVAYFLNIVINMDEFIVGGVDANKNGGVIRHFEFE